MRIDLWGLTALLCAVAFLFFRTAFRSFAWACAATGGFACALVCFMRACDARYGVKRRARRKRHAQAAALVAHWAIAPDFEAAHRCALQAFGEDAEAEIQLIPRHAAGRALDANELLAQWRAFREKPKLILLCTGAVEPAALALAETLQEPQTALLDMRRLRDVVAASDLPLPDAPKTRIRSRLAALAPDRAKSGRCAWYALLSIVCYLLLGRIVYLVAALPLAALAVLGLRRGGARERRWPMG